MIPDLPSYRHVPIEREDMLPPLPHPSEEANRKAIEERQKAIERFEAYCYRLSAADPRAWAGLMDSLQSFHGQASAIIRRGPFHYLGGRIDPQFFSLCQAFACGQLELLEAMLQFVPKSISPEAPAPAPKTFFARLLDKLKRLCKW